MRTKCFCLVIAVLAFSGSQPVLHDIKPTATVSVSAAVAGSNGRFAVKNLPPGNYTIAAWHEKYGTQTQQVSIAAGETKTLDFVFRARLQAAKSL